MLADKTRTATINGLNQLFKIKSTPGKRSTVEIAPDAIDIVKSIPIADRVVKAFDVDEVCDKIISGEYEEQQNIEFFLGGCFKNHIEKMSYDYCNHIKTDCIIGSKCFSCPFHKKADDISDMHDGYCECWFEKAGFNPAAASKPLIKDMSGQYIGTKRDDYIKDKKFFMCDLTDADLKRHSDKKHKGLDHYERKWLQIRAATGNNEILSGYSSNMKGDVYIWI